MSTVIKLKKSETALSKPTTSDIVAGEVAINALDQRIFVRDSNSNIITIGEAGGKRHESATVEYEVTVASKDSKHRYNGTGSSSGYKIDGTFSPTLELVAGNTYKFDQSDATNNGHPLRFYYEAAKTTAYTTNVTTSGTPGTSGAYTQIVVGDATPTVLHYQCSAHGYMGNQVVIGTRNLTGFDTDDVSEGSSNLYYTDARANSAFDTRLGTKDTDDVSEGSTNLYYTDARVDTEVDAHLNVSGASSNQFLQWSGSDYQWAAASGGSGISEVSADTTPELGGDLGLNSNDITGTGNVDITGDLTLTSTDSSSSAGPIQEFYKNSSSPADGDYLGQIKFQGENDAGQKVLYAKVTGKISDVTDTTEDGLIEFALRKAGSNSIGARLTSTDLKLINGTGLEVAGNATLSGPLNPHTIPSGTGTLALTSDLYTDSDVDTHLNQSSASTNQVLSWNGSDYAWVNQSGGGGGSGNAFTNFAVSGQSTVQADSSTDTLTLVGAGLNTITTNATSDTITIGTPTGIPFVKEDGTSTSLNMSVEAGTLSDAVSNLYIPFTKEDGTAVTTLIMS